MFDKMIRITIADRSPANIEDESSGHPTPAPLPESEKKTFEVYRGVLVFYSDYFRASLEGGFREAVEKHIELNSDDVDVSTFNLFKCWLYTRKIQKDGLGETGLGSLSICKLWIFADAYLTPLLKNHCINLLCQQFAEQDWLTVETIDFVYSHTMESSSLRKYFVDNFVDVCDRAPSFLGQAKAEEWPNEFLYDALRAMWARNSGPTANNRASIQELDICSYHDHPQGSKCSRSDIPSPCHPITKAMPKPKKGSVRGTPTRWSTVNAEARNNLHSPYPAYASTLYSFPRYYPATNWTHFGPASGGSMYDY